MILFIFFAVINFLFWRLGLKFKAANYLFNAFNHFALCVTAILCIAHDDEMSNVNDVLYDKIVFAELLSWWIKSYLIFDVIVMILTQNTKLEFYVHHAVCIVFFNITQTGYIHYYVPYIILFEVSSIPLNLRYFLLEIGVPKTHWLVLNFEQVFFVSFFIFRLLIGSICVVQSVIEINRRHLELHDFISHYVIPHLVLCITIILHVYWVWYITEKITK